VDKSSVASGIAMLTYRATEVGEEHPCGCGGGGVRHVSAGRRINGSVLRRPCLQLLGYLTGNAVHQQHTTATLLVRQYDVTRRQRR